MKIRVECEGLPSLWTAQACLRFASALVSALAFSSGGKPPHSKDGCAVRGHLSNPTGPRQSP